MHIGEKAKEIAEFIGGKDNFHVVAHLDADGVCAGAIAVKTLEELGKEYKISFVKQVDLVSIEKILDENPEVIWFTDLGVNMSIPFSGDIVITDHHEVNYDSHELRKHRFNPNDFGIDGGIYLSGAGATYLVARYAHAGISSYSHLAVIGACGDLQDRRERKLVGMNRDVLREAVKERIIGVEKDVQYFGRESKPLFRFLFYADDPFIPGVSGSEEACIAFLLDMGFSRRDIYRRWVDLDLEDKRKIVSEIARRLLDRGFGADFVKRLVGEVYILLSEKKGTELHDAREFATLLNSTARYGGADIALKLCLGDRDRAFSEAKKYLSNHRQSLSEGLDLARSKLEKRKHLYYFHGESRIKDTVVGSITSILSKEILTFPIVGFANSDNDFVKVSVRCRDDGIDLSEVVCTAALSVGGTGGGHRNAAGALIPRGTEERFLGILEGEIENQLPLEVL